MYWKLNFTVEIVIQIKGGIRINVNVSVKIRGNIIRTKKVIFETLLHVFVEKVIN